MTDEGTRFTEFVDKVLRVPHSQIKAALDAEKEAKKKRKKSKRPSSVSRVAGEKV